MVIMAKDRMGITFLSYFTMSKSLPCALGTRVVEECPQWYLFGLNPPPSTFFSHYGGDLTKHFRLHDAAMNALRQNGLVTVGSIPPPTFLTGT